MNSGNDAKLSSTVGILENALDQSKAEVGELRTLIENICIRLQEAEILIKSSGGTWSL